MEALDSEVTYLTTGGEGAVSGKHVKSRVNVYLFPYTRLFCIVQWIVAVTLAVTCLYIYNVASYSKSAYWRV